MPLPRRPVQPVLGWSTLTVCALWLLLAEGGPRPQRLAYIAGST